MSHPWEYIIHGDAEAAVIDLLKNDSPELPHLPPHPPLTISGSMNGFDTGKRWIFVTQEGSFRRLPKIDRPRIDVQVYAERNSIAKNIADRALASILRARGHYKGFGLRIVDVRLEQGLTEVPDKFQETEISRYIFAVRLTTVPYGEPLTVPFS